MDIVAEPGFPFVSVTEAAVIIGVTPARVRQMLATEEMKGYKCGETWAVPEKEAKRVRDIDHDTGRPRSG